MRAGYLTWEEGHLAIARYPLAAPRNRAHLLRCRIGGPNPQDGGAVQHPLEVVDARPPVTGDMDGSRGLAPAVASQNWPRLDPRLPPLQSWRPAAAGDPRVGGRFDHETVGYGLNAPGSLPPGDWAVGEQGPRRGVPSMGIGGAPGPTRQPIPGIGHPICLSGTLAANPPFSRGFQLGVSDRTRTGDHLDHNPRDAVALMPAPASQSGSERLSCAQFRSDRTPACPLLGLGAPSVLVPGGGAGGTNAGPRARWSPASLRASPWSRGARAQMG